MGKVACDRVTERALRREGMTAARERGTGRLFDGVPHVPDGLLILADGRRVAVEVELSAKGSARYRSVLGWYATALDLARVRWFVADRQLRDRLEALVRSERLDDLASVEPLPRVLVRNRRPAIAGAGTHPRPMELSR